MKIELDDDTIDNIVCATIKEHLKYAKKNVKELRAKKKKSGLKEYEQDDLTHNEDMQDALGRVYGYFGGYL